MGRAHRRRFAHPAGALAALTLCAAACGGEVPILMYHSIGEGQDGLSVSPARFEEHLDFLKDAGFETVSLKQVVDHQEGRGDLPARPIVLSFDDGFADAYAAALPALRKRGMRGTFFVVSGFLAPDESARQVDPSTGRKYLLWSEVKALRDAGMEIGSHTVRHGELSHLAKHELRFELEESKRALQNELGQPVDFFAYPFTRQRLGVRKAVLKAGYKGAVVGPHGGIDKYELQRIVIHRWMTVDDLRGMLAEPWGAQ